NLGRHLLLLGQLLAGPLDLWPLVPSTALDARLLTYAIATLIGLVVVTRRAGGLLLPLSTVPVLLGLAYLNTSKYEPVPDGRYLAPLLPLAAIALGAAANVGLGRRPGLLRLAGCLAIGAFLVLQPLQQLGAYYARPIHETPT